MLDEKIYQEIFDEIQEFIPSDWERIVFYLEYGEGSYTCEFYVKKDDIYIKCYDIPDLSEDNLLDSFGRIDEIVSQERKKALGELWTSMTMTIEMDGNMRVDFDYSDLTEKAYRHTLEWKKYYLV